ncbi:MAG: hypothetical protein HYY01_13970 [Chloroflexi bacterium]|nr:hypothetical protein [Chloroflexota bacterium]
MKRVTLVVEDEALYTAVKVQAVRQHRTLREVIHEAMAQWLEAQEDEEALALHREALAEPGENVEAHEFFVQLA